MNDLLIWFYRYIYKLLAAELLLSRNLFDLRLSQHFCLVLCTFVIQLHHYTHKICPYCKSLCVSLWLIHIMNSQCLTRWHWELNAVLFISYIYTLYNFSNPLHTNVCCCKLCAQFGSNIQKIHRGETVLYIYVHIDFGTSEWVCGRLSTHSLTQMTTTFGFGCFIFTVASKHFHHLIQNHKW